MPSTTRTPVSDWPPCDDDVAAAWKKMTIPVHFHVIHDGNRGKVAEKKLEDQLEFLNTAFADGSIEFREASLGYHDRGEWFRMGLGDDAETKAKSKLGKDTKHSLNFYTANIRGTGLNGYGHQPWEYKHFPKLDGVVVHYNCLPDDPEPYHLGGLGVHEVGHWLGLHHTFEGYGSGNGDGVPDTPDDQVVPTPCNVRTRQDGIKQCAGGKLARNFMDRVCDCSENKFTLGQFCRIRNVVLPKYKPWLLP